MTRKIISLCLALLLCISLAVSVSAEGEAVEFIIDETGSYLTDSELESLNEYAQQVYKTCGSGIFYVYTTAADLSDYDIDSLTGGMNDYFVMLENETAWYVFSAGAASGIIPTEEDEIRAVYDAAGTYVGAVSAYLDEVSGRVGHIEDTPEGDILDVNEYFLYDEADLVPDEQEFELTANLMDLSHKYNAQIVIATIPSMDGGDIDEYVNYAYDSMGFGYGDKRDGVLLLVCMDPRAYRILSNGFAGDAIDPDDISNISEVIVSDLSDGNYADAFGKFADQADYYLNGYLNGFPFNVTKSLKTSLIIGVIVGVITALVLKGQLKSVRKQNQANNYVRPGSMQLTVHNDFFLYRNVTRTKKSSSNGSKGSSGSSRSVGGGSF